MQSNPFYQNESLKTEKGKVKKITSDFSLCSHLILMPMRLFSYVEVPFAYSTNTSSGSLSVSTNPSTFCLVILSLL